MPTIDELLNASNEVATCTVNPDTREIIVPEKYKILGVFSDEKVTKIPFTCPKVVGNNVDLTEYNLYINYQNAIGRHNAYLVDDVAVSGDNITFSWLLSRDVTLSSGVVKYSLCAKKLNGDSISNEWNTTIANGVVIQGLEATQAIVEENSDIIEAIISKAHTHANKSVLDKFAEADGKPTYDGKALGGGSPNAVLYTAQTLTGAQKKQARDNVDASASDFVIDATITDISSMQCTLDKTYAQIREAVQDGNKPVVHFADPGGTGTIIMPLTDDFGIGLIFRATITVDDGVTNQIGQYNISALRDGRVIFGTAAALSLSSDGNMAQQTMAKNPSHPMQIATKKYVDDHSGGGTDMGITGATVGQIAKITAVDESGKPTAWAPVNIPVVPTADISANTSARHSHTNKDVLDSITAADKTKLNSVENGANKTIVDTAMSDTSTNPVQNKVIKKYIDDHSAGSSSGGSGSSNILTSPVMICKPGEEGNAGIYLSTIDTGEKQAEIKLEDANENSAVAIANLRTPTGANASDYAATKGYVDSKVPTALKNPNALTIKIGSTTVTYDGSTAQTVTIADGSEVAY